MPTCRARDHFLYLSKLGSTRIPFTGDTIHAQGDAVAPHGGRLQIEASSARASVTSSRAALHANAARTDGSHSLTSFRPLLAEHTSSGVVEARPC